MRLFSGNVLVHLHISPVDCVNIKRWQAALQIQDIASKHILYKALAKSLLDAFRGSTVSHQPRLVILKYFLLSFTAKCPSL